MAERVLLAHVPTESVNEGFLPAARRLGLSVTLLTDHADAHRRHFAGVGLPAYPDEIVACDVFNPLAVIEQISGRTERPAAVFSNSDHLQTSAALAAAYLGLPGKEWRVAYRAKNKAAMRSFLRDQGIDTLWHAVVTDDAGLAAIISAVPLPCVAKPREGVGSQQVRLCQDRDQLVAHCRSIWAEQPGRALLVEEYVAGELYTLETLGDGVDLRVLGSFRVTLGPPPNFVELEARWGDWLTPAQQDAVLRQITAFGVGFGSCHTELVLSKAGPRLIEINYRTVGDHREFMLEHTLGISLFETILRLHLGERLGGFEVTDRAAAVLYFATHCTGEIMTAPAGFLREEGGLRIQYRALRQAGERVSVTHSNKDYLGVLSASAPNAAMLQSAMQATRAHLNWDIAA
jgi:biotin carboxylase